MSTCCANVEKQVNHRYGGYCAADKRNFLIHRRKFAIRNL